MTTLVPILIFGLTFGSVAILTWQLFPSGAERLRSFHQKKVEESAKALDAMFVDASNKKRLALIHILTPLILGGTTFFIMRNVIFAGGACALGLILPGIILKGKQAKRQEKFRQQLVDGLMILSSSLRGGLSLLQSIEVVVEEMPAPMSEEFGLVLRENKMGMGLEESLEQLNKRMRCHQLNLVTTAILVARETGGDVAEVFGRLIESFRETSRIIEKVKTLTLQGRLQGIIMSILPIFFGVVVYTTNPRFLNIMFVHPMGRMLLSAALILEIVGSFLIWQMSKVDV